MAQNDFQPAEKDSNILAALACLLGTLVALVVYLLRKEDKFVRFYALQAIVFDICAGVVLVGGYILFYVLFLSMAGLGIFAAAATKSAAGGTLLIIPFIFLGLVLLAMALSILIKLWCTYKSFKGEMFRIPKLGSFVEKHI